MYKLLLCRRYLRTRLIALASIISVTLGVATMIVVNSVMDGFSTQMKDRIHGLLADVVLESRSTDGVYDPDRIMALAKEACGDDIVAMTPTVEIYGIMSFEDRGQSFNQAVTLIGIDPAGKNAVSPLENYLLSRAPAEAARLTYPLDTFAPDTPLDWELTPGAADERRMWIDNRNFRRDVYGTPEDATEEEVVTAQAAPIRTVSAETADTVFDPFATGDTETADGVTPAAAAGEHTPFFEFDDVPAEPVDPYAPEAARIYLGAGIVSYPIQDPETDEVRTHCVVRPGQDVTISTIKAGVPDPVRFQATVSDLFRSGMAEYDSAYVFCNLEELQKHRGMLVPSADGGQQGAVTSIQIKLAEEANASEVVARLRGMIQNERVNADTGELSASLYSVLDVRTWQDKQGPLLEAVAVESAILNVLLSLIVAVAGFGILAIFYMIVMEKTRDIGILKALGASSRGVMSIFLSYGLSLGVVGSGCGVILGLLFVHYINEIESLLSTITGADVFNEAIYFFREIPTSVEPMKVLFVSLGAVAIATLASVLPARRAASLHPVEALRHE